MAKLRFSPLITEVLRCKSPLDPYAYCKQIGDALHRDDLLLVSSKRLGGAELGVCCGAPKHHSSEVLVLIHLLPAREFLHVQEHSLMTLHCPIAFPFVCEAIMRLFSSIVAI